MLDPKSSDFAFLVHNWCESQRMNENIFIMNEFDNPETRSTLNFFRNRVLNDQIEEAKNIIKSINSNANQSKINHFLPANIHLKEASSNHTTEQSNIIAHSLVQEQNHKLNKLYKKLDEFSETESNNDNS